MRNFRELYEKIGKAEWFKEAYHNKSLGEVISLKRILKKIKKT